MGWGTGGTLDIDGTCGLAVWERRRRLLDIEKASSKLDVGDVPAESISSSWTLEVTIRGFACVVLGRGTFGGIEMFPEKQPKFEIWVF